MSAIAAARELLPAWVAWAPLLYVPLLFLLSFAAATIGAALTLGPVRRAGEVPWAERARRAQPPRSVAGLAAVIGLLGGAGLGLFAPFPLCPVPAGVLTLLFAFAGYAGGAAVAYRVERTVRRGDFPLRDWLRGLAVVWLMFNGWLALLLVLAAFMPRTFDARAGLLLAGGAIVLTFFTLGGGLLVAQFFGLVRPASPALQALVARTAETMGVPVRAVHEVDYPAANAFAVITLRRLAFTPRLIAGFDDNELAAITAHELGHLTESRLMILGRVAPMAFILVLAAAVPIVNDLGVGWLMAINVLWLVVAILVGRLSRQLEHRADRIANQAQVEEGAYARALARIHELNLTPVVEVGKGSTHPHLYDRLVAVGAPPDYPRPAAPSRRRLNLAGAAVALVWMALLVVVTVAFLPWRSAERTEPEVVRSLALGGLAAHDLYDLARLRWGEGNMEEAVTFFAAAAAADRRSVHYPTWQAITLARLGRLEEAEEALAEAERRWEAAGWRARDEGSIWVARRGLERARGKKP